MKRLCDFYIRRAGLIGAVYCAVPNLGWLKDWINKTIPLLTDSKAKERISQLASKEEDIGAYLYESGRCAVAHASVDPVVDPDNPNDFLRLSADMPVARALAEYLMENELGLSQ